MKNFFIAMAVVVAAATSSIAGDCPNGGCDSGAGLGYPAGGHFSQPKTWGPKANKYERFTGWFHSSSTKRPPVAPWYMYFPYNGMFMTPGPMAGANPYGGQMVNPYFGQ